MYPSICMFFFCNIPTNTMMFTMCRRKFVLCIQEVVGLCSSPLIPKRGCSLNEISHLNEFDWKMPCFSCRTISCRKYEFFGISGQMLPKSFPYLPSISLVEASPGECQNTCNGFLLQQLLCFAPNSSWMRYP